MRTILQDRRRILLAALCGVVIGLLGYGFVGASVFSSGAPDAISQERRQAIFEAELANLIESVGETISVVDSAGNEVGFIRAEDLLADLFMSPSEARARSAAGAAPARVPVWHYETEQLVGFMIEDVGYVPLSSIGSDG